MPTGVSETTSFPSSVTGPAGGDPRTAASVRAMGGPLASRTKFLKTQVYDRLFGEQKLVTGVDTALNRLTVPAHGLSANDPARIFAANGGTLPVASPAFTDDEVLYAIVVDPDTIALSRTSGPGSAVDITAGLSGDVYVQKVPDWASQLLLPAIGSMPAGTLRSMLEPLWSERARPFVGDGSFPEPYAASWQYAPTSAGGFGNTWQHVADAGAYMHWRVFLPHGRMLNTLRVRYKGETGHGSLPSASDRAGIALVYNVLGGELSETTVASVRSSAATVGDYEAFHTIEATGINHTIDTEENAYYLKALGEKGASFVAGGLYWQPFVEVL